MSAQICQLEENYGSLERDFNVFRYQSDAQNETFSDIYEWRSQWLQTEVQQDFWFEWLSFNYTITNKRQVRERLDLTEERFNTLLKTYGFLRQYFESSKLELTTADDPDSFVSNGLVIYVYTRLDVKKAFKSLDRFNKNFWLKQSAIILEKVCIDVRFDDI